MRGGGTLYPPPIVRVLPQRKLTDPIGDFERYADFTPIIAVINPLMSVRVLFHPLLLPCLRCTLGAAYTNAGGAMSELEVILFNSPRGMGAWESH
jgi:hypothetical protein